MYELFMANKNYSSWSLRPWVLMRELCIEFKERLVPFADAGAWNAYRRLVPNGKVPCLADGAILVWDSLAIIEYLAERHPGVWPADATARAWARSAAAEMHSGFAELRSRCSMTCGVRIRLDEIPAPLQQDIDRLDCVWAEGLGRFGGPYLAGGRFTAVDAFFAPMAFRIRSYDLHLGTVARHYAGRLLAVPAMQSWYNEALCETLRDPAHEEEILRKGTVVEDARARVRADG